MYNSDTEMLFPMRVMPNLDDVRGEEWRKYIQKLTSSDADLQNQLGFVLMMIKQAGCVTCNADSFRAMRGCTQCARQVVRRYRGNDRELIQLVEQAKQEWVQYQERQTHKG